MNNLPITNKHKWKASDITKMYADDNTPVYVYNIKDDNNNVEKFIDNQERNFKKHFRRITVRPFSIEGISITIK